MSRGSVAVPSRRGSTLQKLITASYRGSIARSGTGTDCSTRIRSRRCGRGAARSAEPKKGTEVNPGMHLRDASPNQPRLIRVPMLESRDPARSRGRSRLVTAMNAAPSYPPGQPPPPRSGTKRNPWQVACEPGLALVHRPDELKLRRRQRPRTSGKACQHGRAIRSDNAGACHAGILRRPTFGLSDDPQPRAGC